MTLQKRKPMRTVLVAAILVLLLPGLACNLFSPQSSESEAVVEEPIIVEAPETIETPEAEPEFKPEQVYRLDFEDTVHSVSFGLDGTQMATGTYLKVDIWSMVDGVHQAALEELPHTVMGLAFSPDHTSLYAAFALGGVNSYNLGNGEVNIDFHGGYDNNLALSPDGGRIATGNRAGETWLWDTSNGELINEMNPADYIEGFSEFLTALAFSSDGSIIASGYWNGYIFLWDASSGDLLRWIEPETSYCNTWGLAFSPDGQYLAVGGHNQEFDNVIKVFLVADGTQAQVLEEFSRGGSSQTPVAFSPDGTQLASGAMDAIYIWELPDFALLHTIPIEETASTDWVTDLAFSPDSQTLLAGYWDNYAILWQVQE